MRWKNLRDWHEMYCAGHLIEGAVAHFEATGQRKLLDALCRYADHIDATFGPAPDKKPGYPGHPELELALVRLYHATGEQRYLDLSKFFIDERGQHSETKPHYYDVEALARGDDPKKFWARTYEYNQSHQPIREQEKVVGHAVRAMYLYSAVADLADEFDDATLLETCDRLWDNLTSRRMYITGGIGPSRHNEGFTTDYDLPDETAYAETCATIGLVMWNQRLLQFGGRKPLCRRARARPLQRLPERRLAGRQHLLLREPALQRRRPPPRALVPVPLLPAQRRPHHRQRRQVLLLDRPRRPVGASLRRQRRRSGGRRPARCTSARRRSTRGTAWCSSR